MNADLARYDDVVHAIYDSALKPSSWQQTIAAIADLCGASSALLFTWAHSPANGGFTFPHNISQQALELWAAKSMHEDPYIREASRRNLMTEGAVLLCDELVSPGELLTTPFYRELWQPSGIAGCYSSIVFDTTDTRKLPTVFSIYHGPDEPRFTPSQSGLLRRIVHHLSRALGVMFHLRDQQLQVASSLAALDRLPSGVLLLGARRTVQFANRAAQAAMERGNTVITRGNTMPSEPGELHLCRRLQSHEAELQRAISDALAQSKEAVPEHFSQALVIPDDTGRPHCVIHVAPLGMGHTFAVSGDSPRVIVFLFDLNLASAIRPEILCDRFGTTPAEAEAALQVLQGGTVEAMAARTGVSINTFKTQLKAVYAKTSTNRQADLLKLLLALATS